MWLNVIFSAISAGGGRVKIFRKKIFDKPSKKFNFLLYLWVNF